jgi:hypothetical protein
VSVVRVLARENSLDNPEPTLARVDSKTLAMGEPVVAVERPLSCAIFERFEHVLHDANLLECETEMHAPNPTFTYVISIGAAAAG